MASRSKEPKGKPGVGDWFVLQNSPYPEKVAKKMQRAAPLIEKEFGALTPENLVKFSKRRGTPTHDLFNWNTQKAAHAYWLDVARSLCACVYKRITVEKSADIGHALYSIKRIAGGDREYVQREVLMGDVELRRQKSDDLLRQLLAIVDNANMAELHSLVPQWKKVYAAADSFLPPAASVRSAAV